MHIVDSVGIHSSGLLRLSFFACVSNSQAPGNEAARSLQGGRHRVSPIFRSAQHEMPASDCSSRCLFMHFMRRHVPAAVTVTTSVGTVHYRAEALKFQRRPPLQRKFSQVIWPSLSEIRVAFVTVSATSS